MNRIPFPYAIPDELVVKDIPEKTTVFSDLVPGGPSNYKFGPGEEHLYYKHLQEARFANTKKKGGWDCLRHYEILMNGCIPVFEGLEHCPKHTLVTFPKELVQSALKELLPWEDTPEKIELYNTYVTKLLEHTRTHCTVSALVERFCRSMRPLCSTDTTKKVLMIYCSQGVNYTRELFSIGLRRIFGENFIDYPKNEVLYKGYDLKKAYGNGYTYGGRLEDIDIDRTNIRERIQAHEFDVIIYGKVGVDEGAFGKFRTMPYLKDVQAVYLPDEIAFLYGGDACQTMMSPHYRATSHLIEHQSLARCFIRELDDFE
jgi:hypothetical protein